jgi:hypothetical protein
MKGPVDEIYIAWSFMHLDTIQAMWWELWWKENSFLVQPS